MEPAADACLRCGAPIGLVTRILGEIPVEIPKKGTLCPSCYRDLSPEEYAAYFEH